MKRYETIEEAVVFLKSLTLENGEITNAEYCPGKDRRQFLAAEFRGYRPFYSVSIVLHGEEESNIRVSLGLPAESWNGKFLGLGNGGAAGNTEAASLNRGLSADFATAHTDMGTANNPFDRIPHAALRDFGGRATHLMSVAAKQIIEAFYGEAPTHSYFMGGSTGGQQALREAQDYPEDYDGIICFCPAHDRVALHTQFAWNVKHINGACHDGRVTREEIQAVHKRLVQEYCVECGGAPGDDFLSYPDWIEHVDYSIFQDAQMEIPLSDEKIEILKAVYEGPKDPHTGEHIFEGMTPGAELESLSLSDMLEPDSFNKGLQFPFYWTYGKEMNLLEFDFHEDYQAAKRDLSAILDAVNPDLSEFRDRGGKLMLIHGTADAAIPWKSSMRYYQQVIAREGGLENVLPYFRYFLVPGLAHGAGGPGVQDVGNLDYDNIPADALHDPVAAMDAWVAGGKAPEMLIATGFRDNNFLTPQIRRQRPVYRYPYRTRYVSGDPNVPESYERICEEDE